MKRTCLLICLVAAVGLIATVASKSDERIKNVAPSKPDAPDKFIGREPGEVRDDNGLKMKLIWCPPGFVTMENVEVITEPAAKKEDKPNNDDEVDPKDEAAPKPLWTKKITPVKVLLTKGYWLGKYEVTQSEWKRVMKSEPWKGKEFTKEGADYPATFVSWNGASEFCRKLTEQQRKAEHLSNDWEYTLPTEAQWERACRARTETSFSFGDDESKLSDYAWFTENAGSKGGESYAHRVGQRKPNPWGFYDMHGNVWEWCRDIYSEKLPGGRDPEVEPDGKTGREIRVYRGGCWTNVAPVCRSAIRSWSPQPGERNYILGFRVALSAVR
jgi:formylglycine-generating enzyme required for sulfatase activity